MPVQHAPAIYLLPIMEQYELLYAPLHGITALINHQAAQHIQHALLNHVSPPNALSTLNDLLQPVCDVPIRSGPITAPHFLGLIPTRSCNLHCRYCTFRRASFKDEEMSLELVRDSIDAYCDVLLQNAHTQAAIHFFGGEPFYARTAVQVAVEYAQWRAGMLGLDTHFEATTNGVYNEKFCLWMADHFDTVVLSLDGPPEIQNYQRPGRNDFPTFQVVDRSAKILSEGSVELIIRVCVTEQIVPRMVELAKWLSTEYLPSTVCFEPMTPTLQSKEAGLRPPNPWEFGVNFCQSAQLLEQKGVQATCSTTDISLIQTSVCPMGKDALIVAPNGNIYACYALPAEWEKIGRDVKMGKVENAQFVFDLSAIERVREWAYQKKHLCYRCFCEYHCAGGCHLTRDSAETYKDLCIWTRIITLYKLLEKLGQGELARAWLRTLSTETLLQPSDLLMERRL